MTKYFCNRIASNELYWKLAKEQSALLEYILRKRWDGVDYFRNQLWNQLGNQLWNQLNYNSNQQLGLLKDQVFYFAFRMLSD